MKALLVGFLMIFATAAFAGSHCGGKGYHDHHKPGYYFDKSHGVYYPTYAYPRFNLHGWTWYNYHWYPPKKNSYCKNRLVKSQNRWHGMIRCHTKDGTSREFYLR